MQTSLLFIFMLVLAALVGASIALADEPEPAAAIAPTSSEVEEAAGSPAEIEPEPTDLEAAEELPHRELDREQAGELLEGVFEPEVAGAAGIYSDLHVEKFLAPNVAVIAPGQQPEVADGSEPGATLEAGANAGATLMDSSMPLATEGASGQLEALNLNLERSEGSLAPTNSLLEVEIPTELGEGIELSGPSIKIEPQGLAESRDASTLGDGVAFYPNVAEETDLAVAPTLGGVETMAQLRSPESPRGETYKLDLPSGASLDAEGGGAVVKRGERTLLTVAPPTALDAEGETVPTDLSVEGDRLTIKVTPTPTTDYPILVDPLFQSFEWYARHTGYEIPTAWGEGWEEESGSENPTGTSYYGDSVQYPSTSASMDAFVPIHSDGLDTSAYGHSVAGEARWWIYHVPRYKYDELDRGGSEPETFITRMTTSDVAWRAESSSYSPLMVMGLWGTGAGWASLYTHEGLSGHSINNMGYVYAFPNEQSVPSVKMALVGLYSPETVAGGINAELFVGASTVELSEPAASAPELVSVSGPTEWLKAGKVNIQAQAKDAGLGVYAVDVASEAAGGPTWRVPEGCTGVAGTQSYCPFEVKLYDSIEPESLPTGIDRLKVTAEDPLGHSASGTVEVSVDHTAPEVTLSGSATEQATLGTKRGSYNVKVLAADGTSEHPQSGVAKVFIEFDGTVVKKSEPGCPTENCSVPLEWPIEASKFAAGEHTLKVWAVDAAGNASTPIERKITLTPTPPTLSLSGDMTEQSSVGTSRPRYRLLLNGSAEAGIAATTPAPTFSGSFGTAGTGNGQFSHPAGVARDAAGDIWVVDKGNDRVEEFGPKGEYLSQFGSLGSGPGQFKEPGAITIGPEGKIWVADTGNKRVEQFNAQGQFISTFGSSGSANGQFTSPGGIAVAPDGDIWVADGYGRRLEEFTPGGEFIRSVTKEGTVQIAMAASVAVAPDGDVWFVDLERNRVYEMSETGTLIREFGASGTGNGQFGLAGALTLDAAGNIWVGDRTGGRFEEFNSEGQYLAQFGSKGTGEGQMTLTQPSGVAVGPSGRIWTTDTGNNRIEEWTPADPGSEIVSEIALDGTPVDYSGKTCSGEHCALSHEWTLNSSSVTPGKHVITVTAGDGLGNSVTRVLPIEIQRDTTPPAVEVGGELANAPEGWVQQESYGVHASAIDGGYGVTSLVFKIDGQPVASESAPCPEGGCALALAAQVNMADYSGGAHKAEVVATDGAGNRNVKSWTINVDPEGRISTQEETETLEAVEATSEQTPVAPTDDLLPAEQREGGDDPGLSVSGSEITSTGVPDVTTMTTDPEDGISIKSPEGTTTITPVISETSSTVGVVNGVAGVTADVGKEADQVVRPEYNGMQIAQELRSDESPEAFTWRVHLAPRQELIQVNPTQAEVVYTDGTESFLITAEPAHDATGKPVPTSLSVHGDELTVKVEFRSGSFVYPIVAGEGWETSYSVPVIVEGPEDETQIREREEREAAEAEENGEEGPIPTPPNPITPEYAEWLVGANMQSGGIDASPPEPTCKGTCASASALRTFVVDERHVCQIDHCGIWEVILAQGDEEERPHFLRGYNYSEWKEGQTNLHCAKYWSTAEAILTGLSITEEGCNFHGPWKVYKEHDEHLTVWTHQRVEQPFGTDLYTGFKQDFVSLQDWVWPNGAQQRKVGHYPETVGEG